MEQGVDMAVSNRHYNRLVKEGKTDKAAALSIQSGALWSLARMNEAGIPCDEGGTPAPYAGHRMLIKDIYFLGVPQILPN